MSEIPGQIEEPKEEELVTFRDLRIEDCDDMVAVINSLIDDGLPMENTKKSTREKWLPILTKTLGGIAKGEEICVATETDGHLVGWNQIKLENRDGVPVAVGVVNGLIKEARHRGWGDKMLKTVIDKAITQWGIKKFELKTAVINETAQKSYERNGFVKTGIISAAEGKTKYDYVQMEKMIE